MFRIATAVGALALGASLAVLATASTSAAPVKIFDSGNVYGVENGPTNPTIFTTTKPWTIVEIWTYHWNNAKGITPGTIGLKDLGTGKRYGPWKASGSPGQGGVKNAYWFVRVSVDVPKGRFQILDSDTSTWAQNDENGNRGMAFVMAKPATGWPPLPSALVPIASVANGCGPPLGKASDPRWGDTSTYDDPSGQFVVNFREACNLHDAGYTAAKVRDKINGGIIDYFTWAQKPVDDKFLKDMRKICATQTPALPPVALAACKGRGSTLSFGAESRYNVVSTVGDWFYWPRPNLRGTWVNKDDPTEPALAIVQSLRYVRMKWSGGSAAPGVRGEFRGTLIGKAKGTATIKGHAMITNAAGATTLHPMSFPYNPKKPNTLVISGVGISGTYVRS